MDDASINGNINISLRKAKVADENNEKAMENSLSGCNIIQENAIVDKDRGNEKVIENTSVDCNTGICQENTIGVDEDSNYEKDVEIASSVCNISQGAVIIADKVIEEDAMGEHIYCHDDTLSNSDVSSNDSFEWITALYDLEDFDIDHCDDTERCPSHCDQSHINSNNNKSLIKVGDRMVDEFEYNSKESGINTDTAYMFLKTQDTNVFSLYMRAKYDSILEDQFKDISSKNSQGKTALDIARDENDWKAYRVLVDAGCREDITIKQTNKIAELKLSPDENTREIVQIYEHAVSDESSLFQRENLSEMLNITNLRGENVATVAAEIGDIFTLEKLIYNGAEVNETALLKAVSNHHADCIVRILECHIEFTKELLECILEVPFAVVLKIFLEEDKQSTYQAKSCKTMSIRTMDEPILHKAVRFENIEAVHCLIRAGADEHKCNHRNETAVNIAVNNKNLDLIKELLDSQLNESEKETVFLLSAVNDKYWGILKKCIDEEVDVNCRDSTGRTALMISAVYSSIDNFMTILTYNANVNISDIEGNTALILSARIGNLRMVEKLLKSSASINHQNKKQETALMLSIQADVNHVDALWNSSLSVACSSCNVSIVKLLIKAGANINHKQKEGFSPLHNSVICQNLPIVQCLVESGAEINAQNLAGNTALIIACDNNFIEAVKMLISAGANVNIKNNVQDTALIIACRKDYPFTVQLLLNAKADVNCKDSSGDKPLIIACCQNNKEILQMLINAHVDLNGKFLSGTTALMVACHHRHIDIVQKLINEQTDTNVKNDKGDTALIIACRQNDLDVVQTLLIARAKTDVQNTDGDTALLVACSEENEAIVQTLLLAKADVNAQNAKGDTSLIVACHKNNITVVRYLLIAGADIHVRNKLGNTAVTIAHCEGFLEICKLLNMAQANGYPETRSVETQTTGQRDVDDNLCPHVDTSN